MNIEGGFSFKINDDILANLKDGIVYANKYHAKKINEYRHDISWYCSYDQTIKIKDFSTSLVERYVSNGTWVIIE